MADNGNVKTSIVKYFLKCSPRLNHLGAQREAEIHKSADNTHVIRGWSQYFITTISRGDIFTDMIEGRDTPGNRNGQFGSQCLRDITLLFFMNIFKTQWVVEEANPTHHKSRTTCRVV